MVAFPAAVFLLCVATSLLCLGLLLRAFLNSRARPLLWSAACFVFLAISNLLLFLDLVVFPDVDLEVWRASSTLAAISLLLYGFIWDSE